MNTVLERRLEKLEGCRPLPMVVMAALDGLGYEEMNRLVESGHFRMAGKPARMSELLRLDIGGDVFALEDFRGKVPDEVVREAYASCRNWVSSPEAKKRVLQLAGLTPESQLTQERKILK